MHIFFKHFPERCLTHPTDLRKGAHFYLFLIMVIDKRECICDLPHCSASCRLKSRLCLYFIQTKHLIHQRMQITCDHLTIIRTLLFFFPDDGIDDLCNLRILASMQQMCRSAYQFNGLIFLCDPVAIQFLHDMVDIHI